MRRHAKHQRGSQPDRKSGKLNRRRNPDQISAPGVVGFGQAGGNSDDRRYDETAQRTLESSKKDWAPAYPGNHRPCQNRKRGTDDDSPEALDREAAIPV